MIKIKPDPKRPAVTKALRKAVTEIPATVTKKRGRPKKVTAASNADRQRAYRERKAAT